MKFHNCAVWSEIQLARASYSAVDEPALLELADANANTTPLGTNRLADIKEASPDSSSLDFGWEALARQNARVGKSDVHDEAHTDPEKQRFRPMTDAGKALGQLDGR